MKKNIGIIITVITTLILSILGFVLGGFQLSELQLDTLSILIIVCVISMVYCFIVGEITKKTILKWINYGLFYLLFMHGLLFLKVV